MTKQSLTSDQHSPPVKTKRDGYIDFFKGALILWVIHLHTVFGPEILYVPAIIVQVSPLIDVPVFFFISGYLSKPLNFSTSFQKSANQFINLYLNYLIQGCLVLLCLCLVFILQNKPISDLPLAIISMLKVEPDGDLWEAVPAYLDGIWYIRVFLSLLLFVPFVLSFAGSRWLRLSILAFLLVAFGLSKSVLSWDYNFLLAQPLYIYFYLSVYVLGLAYKVDERNIRTHHLAITLLLNVIICLLIFHFNGNQLLLRGQKFPPTLNYLAYSLLLVHLFIIAKRLWRYADWASTHSISQALEWCGRNVYFIYLFQGVICSIPVYYHAIVRDHLSSRVLYCIDLTFNISFSLLITFLYVRARTFSLNFVQTKMPYKSTQ